MSHATLPVLPREPSPPPFSRPFCHRVFFFGGPDLLSLHLHLYNGSFFDAHFRVLFEFFNSFFQDGTVPRHPNQMLSSFALSFFFPLCDLMLFFFVVAPLLWLLHPALLSLIPVHHPPLTIDDPWFWLKRALDRFFDVNLPGKCHKPLLRPPLAVCFSFFISLQ